MRIAVVGSGVSGLSTTWLLNEYSDHEVHLFEADDRVGGHTNTVHFDPPQHASSPLSLTKVPDHPQDAATSGTPSSQAKPNLQSTPVDTGFIVFNEVTYPNFLRFLRLQGVDILDSDMSFSVSRSSVPRLPRSFPPIPSFGSSLPTITNAGQAVWANRNNQRGASDGDDDEDALLPERGAFEWAGGSPSALFCQFTSLFDPSHWRMVWEIIRFNHEALVTLRLDSNKKRQKGQTEREESICEWLDARGYSDSFRKNYLIPMTACIWSTPPGTALQMFPAVTLLRFMHNHHLLQILNRPQWLTIRGGSSEYIQRILSKLPPGRLHTGQSGAVQPGSAKKFMDGNTREWTFVTADGQEHRFDKIVFATHADISLGILDAALDGGEPLRTALEQFKFSKNKTVLHSDERLMPVRRAAWSAWNFLAEEQDGGVDLDRVTLTYWMNLLQSLPSEKHGPVLVTLNPPPGPSYPAKHLIVREQAYEHPIYTSDSVHFQAEVEKLQGSMGLYFAGAWLKYGFHEDGFSSGMRAAIALGAKAPFEPIPAERPVPHLLLATALVALAERARSIATALFASPVVFGLIVANVLIELAVNIAFAFTTSADSRQSRKCQIRNTLREIRIRWEGSLGHVPNGDKPPLWHPERAINGKGSH
ncbi:FAD/NAD(P)-binding domain-containing protein [Tilletiaria anomala UBC 951]|uniref:FAD/NAD(P)-binding domain-containing protein n=1 Tax=Tilletiaria anomala (strain ATCC 24038 / CBS 436.72 / UBC 951) TaxID=1037660 RepID=A0A066WBR7_TILAU|nr:FAD/NAD(P)-binding domain-containing protein [Tilletiaria anomala UBC 951]KDN51352.1 FAD/NAD(P)-binding domain-containing protein [Tilletiaria anomala UBC 951]